MGRSFASVAVERDGSAAALVADTRVSLTFEDRSLTWEAGCNQIGGPVEVTGTTLRVGGDVVTTDMACGADLQEQDEWVSEFLTSEPNWGLEDDTLTLTGGSVRMVFEET